MARGRSVASGGPRRPAQERTGSKGGLGVRPSQGASRSDGPRAGLGQSRADASRRPEAASRLRWVARAESPAAPHRKPRRPVPVPCSWEEGFRQARQRRRAEGRKLSDSCDAFPTPGGGLTPATCCAGGGPGRAASGMGEIRAGSVRGGGRLSRGTAAGRSRRPRVVGQARRPPERPSRPQRVRAGLSPHRGPRRAGGAKPALPTAGADSCALRRGVSLDRPQEASGTPSSHPAEGRPPLAQRARAGDPPA